MSILLVGRDHNLQVDILRSESAPSIGAKEPDLVNHFGVPTLGSNVGQELFEALGCVFALHKVNATNRSKFIVAGIDG